MLRSIAILGLTGLLSLPCPHASANALHRDRDPVVLTGAALPTLAGAAPDRIVAFRYAGSWIQIPVQVDERAVVSFGSIYNDSTGAAFSILTYTDSTTWTGADPDPAFDADDELVFMARDAGDLLATIAEPAGVLPGTGVVVTVQDSIGGGTGYVYLFRGDGSLDPGPGPDPVTNGFYLLPSGASYKSQYDTRSGPNPENTVISSSQYSVHFSDRWICNEMHITAGAATGADILDRRKALFAPGNCTRSETTFSNGEGALIVNRQGPLRVLRGYCGANSGPTTYRVHKFYESREDVTTTLRVHPIPGIMDFFDYSPGASGMVYTNDLNTAGVTIDGSPDAVATGPIQWEMVTGTQGTLVMAGTIDTDIPGFTYTSYYEDLSPAPNQCTGDNSEYGASGIRIANSIPNTDPALGAYDRMVTTRVISYAPPNQDVAFAQARALEARKPLTATAVPYAPTAVAAEHAAALEFRMDAGPSPFRGRAPITVTLPAAGAFSLRIYDASGRALATLALGPRPAGRYAFAWNAGRVPAGVYFATARLDGYDQRVMKLVVLR